MSELKTTSLSHKDNNTGTPNITMYSDGTTSIGLTHTGGFKNHLINSSFVVDQRFNGNSTTLEGSNRYYADRWQIRGVRNSGGSGTYSIAQTSSGNKLIVSTSGMTDLTYIQQFIERQNIQHLAGKEVTVSISANFTPSLSIYAYDGSGTELTVFESQSMSYLSGARYSHTFTLPDMLLGGTETGRGLLVVFQTPSPASSTAYEFWQPQLEPGPTASDFEFRFIGTETSLCQRYYYTFSTQWFAPYWHGYDNNCSRGGMSFILPTEMRIPPNKTLSGLNWVSNGGVNLIETYGATPQLSVSTSRITAYLNTTSQPPGGVQGQCLFVANLDAEL